MRRAFDTLGAKYSCRMARWMSGADAITSEGGEHYCEDVPDCHIMYDKDPTEESVEMAMARGNGSVRGVHIVRNPSDMLASAYCYHHQGQKPSHRISYNPQILPRGVGAPEGMMLLWPMMSEVMGNMAKNFANKGLHHIRFEKLTESSASFDQQVNGMFEHLFGGLISRKEHEKIAEAAKAEDLNRQVSAEAADHTNSDECMAAALQAQPSFDASVKAHLGSLQIKLGY